jgi:hypothetical protein
LPTLTSVAMSSSCAAMVCRASSLLTNTLNIGAPYTTHRHRYRRKTEDGRLGNKDREDVL